MVYDTPYTNAINNNIVIINCITPYVMYVSSSRFWAKEVKGCRVYDTPVYDTPYTMAIINSYNKRIIHPIFLYVAKLIIYSGN
jgi:hypothetical protein